MTAPRLSQLPLWERFEERAHAVISRALSLLQASAGLDALDELQLNRLLLSAIAEATSQLKNETGEGFDYLPSYDGHQAPDVASTPSAFERKRPDFTWTLLDHAAASGLDGCREFAVECKRLGDMSGSTRSHEYVDNGVVRFVAREHKYGLRGRSGAMVGYLQGSDVDTVLADVRGRLAHRKLTDVLEDVPRTQVVRLRHALGRSFGATPFNLVHYWRDVR